MRIVCRWFLFIIFIYCASEFFVSGEDYAYEHPFQVDKDLMRVEDVIIKYTKHMKNGLKAALRKLGGKLRVTKVDPKKDVCQFHDNLKTFMCKVLIKLNYFGLTFFNDGVDVLKCGRQEISLRFQQQNKLKTRDIKMFQCPPLQYSTVDTEEVVVLPVSFYISNTQKEGTACLYIQHGPHYPIFPLQIVSNVEEDALLLSFLNDQMNFEEENDDPKPYVKLITHFPRVYRQFLNFMDIKKELNLYRKFTQLYSKSSICGMPKAHKVWLCRSLTQQDYFQSQLDSDGYDEAKCRREEVLSHSKNQQRFTVTLFKCPPLYFTRSKFQQYLEHSLFLSTNSVEKSFIIYQRLNFKGKAIRLDSYAINLDDEILLMDRRRTREILPAYQPEAQITDMQRELVEPDRTPRQGLLNTSVIVTFDRHIVEDNVIEFIEVRAMKKPYAHFQRTFANINVSGLRQKEIINLCELILQEDFSYHLTVPEIDKLNPIEHGLRKHIRLRLIMRDTEKLPRDKISSRQCPPVVENQYGYFISASAKKDAVIIHVKYDYEDLYSIPESFVSNIDRKILTEKRASVTRSISFRPQV